MLKYRNMFQNSETRIKNKWSGGGPSTSIFENNKFFFDELIWENPYSILVKITTALQKPYD